LQSLIKSLDSQIVINDRGPGVLAAMVHQYYGFCADSVGTANELGGIMPHTVRQHLYRLHRIWVRMQAGEEVREPVFMRTRCCACGSDVFTTHACDECASIRHYRRGRERKAASSNQKNTSSPASDRRDARWTEELMKAIDERWPTGR
jgi:hypothetical protein